MVSSVFQILIGERIQATRSYDVGLVIAGLAPLLGLVALLVLWPRDVKADVDLARATYQKMVQNLCGPPVYASGGVAEIEEVCYYLDASVFSAAGGAFRLAGYAEYPFSR